MATKVHHQALPGTGDLHLLLNLINNKERYTKALGELEFARLKANEAIEKLALGRNISSLHSGALEDRKRADSELEAAKVEADKTLKDAYKAMTDLKAEFEKKESKYDEKVKFFVKSSNETKTNLAEREEQLKKAKIVMDAFEVALNQRETKLNKLQEEVEEKRQILSDSIERLQ